MTLPFRAALGALLLMRILPVAGRAQNMETLSLDQAVSLALRDNRNVKSADIETSKYDDKLAEAHTRRFPALSLSAEGGTLLTRLNFVFDRGAFGTFPGIGPIPAENTDLSTARKMTALVLGQVSQPLTQQYKIGLNMALLRLSRELAREQSRAQRETIVHNVKQVYYAILQTESALQNQDEQVKFYRELDRTTTELLSREAVLKSESLDVKARLGKSEYDADTLRDTVATQKEQLNLLLGRDVRSRFEIRPLVDAAATDTNLADAETKAIASRTEIRQARLQAQQAGLDERLTRAGYIPDVSLVLRYLSPLNYGNLIPSNITTASLSLSWEPFDWGRHRHEIGEKEKSAEQARYAVRETESSVLVDVANRFRKLRQARKALEVAQLGQEAAREKVRVALHAYREKAILLKDVLQAQSALSAANDQQREAMLAIWSAKADFDKAVGEDQP